MTPNKFKGIANAAGRPLKTSKLNPYVMRALPATGEVRVSPRIAALKAAGHPGNLPALAEAKAGYTDPADARATAAAMARHYRKTRALSALARLTELNDRLAANE
jgi:hypothetical protein